MAINSFKEIQIAYTKTYNNASELIDDSLILLEKNRYARSYLLAHIAIEEFARTIMLVSGIMKFKIRALDVKKLISRQKNHQEKIKVAYSFINRLKNYSSPLSITDRLELMGMLSVSDIIKEEQVQKLDDLKNASLYVDQYNNQSKMPSEIFTKEKAEEMVTTALLFKEFIEFTKWHEEENLIDTIKELENEQIEALKNIFAPNSKKY